MISPAELEPMREHMPGRPSVSPSGHTLYFKSETMLYWVFGMNVSEKTRDAIFARMKDLDFFEDDWLSKAVKETDEAEPLPY